MNESQFNPVKLFLDGFHVEPRKLARAWNIDRSLVLAVSMSATYGTFKETTEFLHGIV